MIDVLARVFEFTNGRVWLTIDLAAKMARTREASPTFRRCGRTKSRGSIGSARSKGVTPAIWNTRWGRGRGRAPSVPPRLHGSWAIRCRPNRMARIAIHWWCFWHSWLFGGSLDDMQEKLPDLWDPVPPPRLPAKPLSDWIVPAPERTVPDTQVDTLADGRP
jgi:hypothetical protein